MTDPDHQNGWQQASSLPNSHHEARPDRAEKDAINGHVQSGFAKEIDRTREFLELYREAGVGLEGVFVLTIIDPRTEAVRPQKFAIEKIDAMANEAIVRGEIANVYFAPAILKKSLPPTARGKVEDIVAVLGLVIDDDGDTGKRPVLPPGITPSFEVTTCQVPCINRHLHFVFSRPLPVATAQLLAELLHRTCGGDHGTGDIDHVWRIPETKNHKRKIDGRGRPAEPQ